MSGGIERALGALWTVSLFLEVFAAPVVVGPAALQGLLQAEAYAAEEVFSPESRAHAALDAVRDAARVLFERLPMPVKHEAETEALDQAVSAVNPIDEAERRRGGFRPSAGELFEAGRARAEDDEAAWETAEAGRARFGGDAAARLDYALGRASGRAAGIPYLTSLRLLGLLAAGRLALLAAFVLPALLLLPAVVLDARASARIRGAELEPGRPALCRLAGGALAWLPAAALLFAAAPVEIPVGLWAALPLAAAAALWTLIAMKPRYG